MPFTRADIRRGLEADEFFPVFQPLVEMRTGQLAGFEVLARWKQRGQEILPAEFIPSMERAGLINELTTAILSKALTCTLISERQFMVAFNFTPTQLVNPLLPEQLKTLAWTAGFPLDRLTVEITESALVDDLARAGEMALALKALHCRLALDDFGTGYSSLTHLHALPFDELKVDRTFVHSMTEKRESREIVAAVVGLGLGLGLMTVAEGVETRQQAEMLFWMGCDLAQGWLYGKPVPAGELAGVLSQAPWESPAGTPESRDLNPLASLQALPAHRLAQLQAIYDGAPVGLCLLDRNLRYLSLNRQLAEMNGVPAAAHLGRKVSEVVPHVYKVVEPFLQQALAGEPVTGIEVNRPAPGGNSHRQMTIMLSYRTVRGVGGDVVGVSVAVMDVTQRKRMEEALRESEDHYRHMVKLNPHVPWLLNDHGEVVERSPRWEDYTGQPTEEALGNGWLRALHPDDVAPTQEAIQRSLDTGLPIDVEYRVRKPGEDWKWMRSRGSPRFSSSGKVQSIYGVVEEIDEQKHATEELKECEAELRSALNAVPIGIVLADGHDGTIYMVNPKAKAILGGGAFPGQKMTEYGRMGLLDLEGKPVPPEQHPLARAIQHGETIESQPFLLRRADGTQGNLSISSRAILSDEGRRIGGMLMICDLDGDR